MVVVDVVKVAMVTALGSAGRGGAALPCGRSNNAGNLKFYSASMISMKSHSSQSLGSRRELGGSCIVRAIL